MNQISSDQWTAIAAIAQVLAAFATLAAVFFAIYQWNHQWRPKLKVSLDSMLTTNPSGLPSHWIAITITNIGICSVKVTGIQYRPHRFAKMRWFHPPDFENPLCSRLPIKLEQTDSANLLWKPEDWETAICGALRDSLGASKIYHLFWRRTVLVEVKTSVGDAFLSKVPRGLIARLEAKLAQE